MISLMMVLALAQGQDFAWSGTLAAGKRLTVRNVIGDVRIEPATGGTAAVTAVRKAGHHGNPADVTIRRLETRDGVTICVLYPGNRDDDGDCEHEGEWRGDRQERNDTRVDFVVRLPAGVSLEAATVSGDVTGRGLRSSVEARSVSGDVRLSEVDGSLVEVTTVSGDLELESVEAAEVVANTVSGDVDFSGPVRAKGSYELKTLSGDVVMVIPAESGAQVSGSTFSGQFRSDFALTAQATGKYTGSKRIDGRIGDGSARVRIESFSGDVVLRSGNR